MTRLILVGLGARGRTWLEVIGRAEGCRLAALCDPNPEARSQAQETAPNVPAFATLEQTLAEVEADALVLATPPDTRASHIGLACDRALALLVEKPLSDNLEEAGRFVLKAERAGVPLMVGLNFRYLEVTRAMLELIRGGVVGQPAFARFTYERYRDGRAPHLNKYPLTMRHPMLWEQSIHHFDLLRYVYGLEPLSVSCETWNPGWSMYRGDANVSALFTFEEGMTVAYQGSWQSGWQRPHFSWRTDCANGVIWQREQFGGLGYARRFDDRLTDAPLPAHEPWISDASGVLAAFLKHLAGDAPLECSGYDHLRSIRMVQACILSASRRETLRLEPSGEVAMA